jgi:TonB-dependent starch-binding outer membrane protein SusC
LTTNVVSANLKWEATTTTNAGIDIGLWNGKLTYTLDVFQKITTDMLMGRPIPGTVGAGNQPLVNAGKITNTGFEMALTYNGQQGDFRYSVTGTLSHVKNELNELVAGQKYWTGGADESAATEYSHLGYPLLAFFQVKTDGLFRTQQEIDNYTYTNPTTGVVTKIQPFAKVGDQKYIDYNHDGKISPGVDGTGDSQYCGSPFPKYEFGLRLEGSWKLFDASIYFQGTQGNKIYNAMRQMISGGCYAPVNYSTDLLDSYSFNPNSDIPRVSLPDQNQSFYGYSDRWLEDGSYCRLKTLQIGFTLPDVLVKKLNVSRCRFYLGGDNLITWTRYKGYNPDIGNNDRYRTGADFIVYPLNRSYHVGLQMNF